ncbi:unnamed protein product [Cuscuta epithymum]|uniref:DUF3615 domain-containing protein n=1 Tax=Cuscuta epithymum TaxID=186058 RepID=A0AAV0C5R5_9ASTE|nr:unnamed protein product [Cuscuta epithymum]
MVMTSQAYKLRSRTIYKAQIRPSKTKSCSRSVRAKEPARRRGKPVKGRGGYGPPLTQWSAKDLEIMDWFDRRLAKLALDYYHNSCKDGVTYEVVEAKRSTDFDLPDKKGYIKAHTNFTAKPKNSNGSTMLFFAEISLPDSILKPLEASTCTVHGCYMLGAVGEVDTGLNGCLACRGTHGPVLHHPHDDGAFDIGYGMYRLP